MKVDVNEAKSLMHKRQQVDRTRSRLVAVIPARQGSVRLPGKNLELVGGVPLVIRSVKHAQWARAAPIVTTDDPLVIKACSLEGAQIVRRPAQLATSVSPTVASVLHALEVMKVSDQDAVAVLQPTSPFRDQEVFRRALEALEVSPDSLVMTVGSAAKSPSWVRVWEGDGSLRLPKDAGTHVFPSGALYLCNVGVLRTAGGFEHLPQRGVLTTTTHSIDIDDMFDLQLARAVIEAGMGDNIVDVSGKEEVGE